MLGCWVWFGSVEVGVELVDGFGDGSCDSCADVSFVGVVLFGVDVDGGTGNRSMASSWTSF